MADKTYSELLRDPRWRDLSSKVKQRDDMECRTCQRSARLETHHKWYLKNRNPWDYTDEQLITLCRACHERTTESVNKLKQSLSVLDPLLLDAVRGFTDAAIVYVQGGTVDVVPREITDKYASGVASFFRCPVALVLEVFREGGHSDVTTAIEEVERRSRYGET